MTATCCVVTQAGNACRRQVEYKGMVCRQHGVMLTKQGLQERERNDTPPMGFWDYGDEQKTSVVVPACRDRSTDFDDDWVRVDDAVTNLFKNNELPNYEDSEQAYESKRRRDRRVSFADENGGLEGRVTIKGKCERKRCGQLAKLAAINGMGNDETERIADGSGRWIWTGPKVWGKTQPKGYFAQFRLDGRMAVRCECPGCAPKPQSKAKLCLRPVRTADHCVKCTCKDCVCPARVEYRLESQRALTGWWDNPCGGKCGGCKRLATVHCAGAARGWTE